MMERFVKSFDSGSLDGWLNFDDSDDSGDDSGNDSSGGNFGGDDSDMPEDNFEYAWTCELLIDAEECAVRAIQALPEAQVVMFDKKTGFYSDGENVFRVHLYLSDAVIYIDYDFNMMMIYANDEETAVKYATDILGDELDD